MMHRKIQISYDKYFWYLDTIIQESDAGSPCHDGTEETAPTGAYTCNQNVSICLGNEYFQDKLNIFFLYDLMHFIYLCEIYHYTCRKMGRSQQWNYILWQYFSSDVDCVSGKQFQIYSNIDIQKLGGLFASLSLYSLLYFYLYFIIIASFTCQVISSFQ